MPEPRGFWVGEKLLERFRAGVEVGDPGACWLWRGPRNTGGYGQVHVCEGGDRLALLAHRVAWQVENGPIPAGLLVLHSCDVPACCNPGHLRIGTAADNSADMVSRGRVRPPPLVGVRGVAHPRSRYGVDKRARALELAAAGWTRQEIGRELGCHRVTVARWIEEAELASGARVAMSRTLGRMRPAGLDPVPGRVA